MPPDIPAAFDALKLFFKAQYAVLDVPPFIFELAFSRPARADPSHLLRIGAPSPGQARQHIGKLRQLHLKSSFACLGALRENIQDQPRPIDDFAFYGALQGFLLGWRKFHVEYHGFCLFGARRCGYFLDFPLADQSSSVLTSVSWADGLAIVPPATTVEPGQWLDYLPFGVE